MEAMSATENNPEEIMTTQNEKKYLGIALSDNGRIFAHPGDGSAAALAAHVAAKERGDYPYTHLYEGDNVFDAISEGSEEASYR